MDRTLFVASALLAGVIAGGILLVLSLEGGPAEPNRPVAEDVGSVRFHRPARSFARTEADLRGLIRDLTSCAGNTRRRARREFTWLGAEAVPALLALLERDDEKLAAAARAVLAEIGGPAIAGARELLLAEKSRTRLRAVRLLCALSGWWSRRPEGPEVVADLLRSLPAADGEERVAIIGVLGMAGPAAAPHAADLADLIDVAEPPEDRQLAMAMYHLGRNANGTAAALLRLALRSEGEPRNPAWAAAEAVGPDPAGVALLTELLAKPPSSRDTQLLRIAQAFGDAARPALPSILHHALGDETGWLAFSALGAMPGALEDALPVLLGIPRESGGARMPWGEVQDALVPLIPELLATLSDPNPDRRANAARALSAVRAKLVENGPALFGLLNDPKPEVRLAVVGSFGRYKPPIPAETVELLAPALADPDPRVRLWAILALEETNADPGRVAEILAPAISHPDDDTRFHAQNTMGWHTDPDSSVLPAVMENLKHPVWEVRLGALRVVEALGPDAAPAIPILLGYPIDAEFGTWVTGIIAKTGVLDQAVRERLAASLHNEDVTPPWDALETYGPRVLDLESLVLSRVTLNNRGTLDYEPAKALRAMLSDPEALADRLFAESRAAKPDRFRILLSVAGINPPSVDIVAEQASCPGSPLSHSICLALACDGFGALPLLTEAAGLPADPERAEFAVRTLGKMARAESTGVLLQALSHPAEAVRARSSHALGRILAAGHDSDEVVDALLGNLADAPEAVLAATCEALGHVPGPRRDLRILLTRYLESESILVSTRAAGAVWRHGGELEGVLAALSRTLRAPRPAWGYFTFGSHRQPRVRADLDPEERPLEATADLTREMGEDAAPIADDIGWAASRAGDPLLQGLLVDALVTMGAKAAPARVDLVTIRDTMRPGWRGISKEQERLLEQIEVVLANLDK